MTLHVVLRDSSAPVLVPQVCVERSSVLAQASQQDADARVHLPFEQSVWHDWANETLSSVQPLAVAKVRVLHGGLLAAP